MKDIQIFLGVQIGGVKHVVDKRISWDVFEQILCKKEAINYAIDVEVENLKKEVEKNKFIN